MNYDSIYWDLTLVWASIAAWPFLVLVIDFILNHPKFKG